MRLFHRWSLPGKMTAVLLLMLLLVGGGVGGILYFHTRAMLNHQINLNAQAALSRTSERINREFLAAETAAQEIALTLETLRPDVPEQMELIEQTLRRLHQTIPSFCGLSISYLPYAEEPESKYLMLYTHIDKEGEIQVARIGGDDYQYFKFDWFTLPRLLNQAVWTEPYLDTYADILMSTRSQPIRDSQGNFRGMVGFDLSLAGLDMQLGRADAYGYGRVFLLSRFGRFVSFPDELLYGKAAAMQGGEVRMHNATIFSYADALKQIHFRERENSAEQIRQLGRSMTAGNTGVVHGIFSGDHGTPERVFFTPVPTPAWSIGISYPESRLLQPLHDLTFRLAWIAGVGGLLVLFAVWYINYRMTRPLTRLAVTAAAIGAGNFDAPLPLISGRDEIARLTKATGNMQKALKKYIEELKETTAARLKIESELEVARDIQLGILPRMLPPLPDTKDFSLYTMLRPARQVGGDLYDFFFLDEKHFCFIIGDVSGKGVPAAFFMAVTQTLQRSEAEKAAGPGQLVTRINDLLSRNNDSLMFVTYFLGILDVETGEVCYCNAGHNPPCIRHADGSVELLNGRHGPALGVLPDAEYGSDCITLQERDTLILYTDGVVEAHDPAMDIFGMPRLLHFLEASGNCPPAALGKGITEEVDHFAGKAEQADDITLLILRFNRVKDER